MTDTRVEIIDLTFLGTEHHRDTHKHALQIAYDKLDNMKSDNIAMRCFDGIGCLGTKDNPRPGTYTYDESFKKTPIGFLQKNREQKAATLQVAAQLGGFGMSELLQEADDYIASIIQKNNGSLPQTINLKGYSRGADACIRLANRIYEKHPQITINMFLIEPVPGPFHRTDDGSYIIPGNVKELNLTYMLDESKPFLKPQHRGRLMIQNPALTTIHTHYLAGVHGGALYIESKDKPEKSSWASCLMNNEYLRTFIQKTTTKEITLPICIRDRHKNKFWQSDYSFPIKAIQKKGGHPLSMNQNELEIYQDYSIFLYPTNREDTLDLYVDGKKTNISIPLAEIFENNPYSQNIIDISKTLSPIEHQAIYQKLFENHPDMVETMHQKHRTHQEMVELKLESQILHETRKTKKKGKPYYERTLVKEKHHEEPTQIHPSIQSILGLYNDDKKLLEIEPDKDNQQMLCENIQEKLSQIEQLAKIDYYTQQFKGALNFYHYHHPYSVFSKTTCETTTDLYKRIKEILQGKSIEENTKLFPNQYAFMKIKEALQSPGNNQEKLEQTWQNISKQKSFFKDNILDFKTYRNEYVNAVKIYCRPAQIQKLDNEKNLTARFYKAQAMLPKIRAKYEDPIQIKAMDAIGQAPYLKALMQPSPSYKKFISFFRKKDTQSSPDVSSRKQMGKT